MTNDNDRSAPINALLIRDAEVISFLEREIKAGKHWYPALLEAIGLWTTAEEIYQGRRYRYLIGGEAFDWLLLAERLCLSVDGLLPDDEVLRLLFHGRPPLDLAQDEFKRLIGDCKYHQYLNYFYGITVEEALTAAVQDEVRKERRGLGINHEPDTASDVYQRVYGADKSVLLNQFRREKSYRSLKSITLTELKEFTYWLFKLRFKICDKARVASDTRNGLEWLNKNGSFGELASDSPPDTR
jgi:hypothetical protein